LNEPAILHNLRSRFEKNVIYTAVGTILVSVNPFKLLPIYTPSILDKYITTGTKGNPPHIFGSADSAFQSLIDNGISQAVCISGESGAGKTEAMKLILQHLAEASARKHQQEKNALGDTDSNAEIEAAAAPVLSAGMKRRMSVGGEAPAARGQKQSIEQQILLSNPITEVRKATQHDALRPSLI
jgi:myosin heavy subunit